MSETIAEFPGWEEGFDSEKEALAWFHDLAANPPVKRPRAWTRRVKTANGFKYERKIAKTEPELSYQTDHPMDAIWVWYEIGN